MAVSDDLRERVVEAVVLGGLSRNQAAARFKVSVSQLGALGEAVHDHGQSSPAPSGGDRRSRPDRVAPGLSPGPDPAQPGPHAARDPGAADRQLRRALKNKSAQYCLNPCMITMFVP